MKSSPNLLKFINTFIYKLNTKIFIFETYFALSLFCFFLGFISGNLFGTLLIFFRQWIIWDVFIIVLTILFIELINYFYFYKLRLNNFKSNSRISEENNVFKTLFNTNKKHAIKHDETLDSMFVLSQESLSKQNKILNSKLTMRLINFYKLGLLLGFFIDAFKVGS